MQTECSANLFGFARVEGRAVVAGFDGGKITSDAGALLLGATDRAIRLVDRFAECFVDSRAPLAGKSTLNRLERGGPELTRYHRIAWDGTKIEALFVDLFVEAHQQPPKQIILDLDATDDPLHGHQEGRFFHGYYDCYCYLPLYIFSGRHLLAAKLRRADLDAAAGAAEETARIVAQIRARWPEVRIVLRADSRFAREALMSWCEANGIDFLFGLAKNDRLVAEIAAELGEAEEDSKATGQPARRFKEFQWSTRQLEPPAPGRCQGGMDRRRGQSALCCHLAERRGRGAATALRGDLLRPRRHGKPHQGVSARPVCRPYFGSDDARQPAATVVRLDGLCPALRAASTGSAADPIGQSDLRHDPPQAAQDRRGVRTSVRRITFAMASAAPISATSPSLIPR
jgi:hypothetical protein